MNRERAEAHLRLLVEEELRRATAQASDGTAGSPTEDEPVRSVSVTGTLACGAAVPDAVMASRGGQSADRAVTELYSAHYQTLVRHAALLVRDARTAEQVVQDSFAAMHGGGHQLRDVGTALAYLRQDVVNRSRSVMHRRAFPGAVHRARVATVALVLTAGGAVDGQVADQILEDFELALVARQLFPGRSGPGLRSWAPSPGPAGPGARPGRVVRLGQVIPVLGADVSGEAYLLSYARTASGPQLSLLARIGRRPGPDPARSWPEVPLLEQFTAIDDRGTRYRMRVRDLGGGPDGWTLMLDPDPPHDPRWLDLTATPAEPAVRIDLTPSTPPPDTATVTASEATADPGEHLLHALAAWLLAEAAAPPDTVPGPAVPGPRPLPTGAGGLGDVIAALQAAGALSPLSPIPGQLAALCARLNVAGHGITEPPARDLPGPWLSVLAHYQRRKTTAPPARDGCAAAAAAFPELDGITLSILGLHNCQGGTVVHAHASGPMCHQLSYRPAELYYWPVIWIRDSGGRWHTTCTRGQSGMNGEVALRLEVVPPLSRSITWIEVLAAGRSAQARAVLPLRWE